MISEYAIFAIIIASNYSSAAICQYVRIYAWKVIDESDEWTSDMVASKLFSDTVSGNFNKDLMPNFFAWFDKVPSRPPIYNAVLIFLPAILASAVVVYVVTRKVLFDFMPTSNHPTMTQYIHNTDYVVYALALFSMLVAYYIALRLQLTSSELKRSWSIAVKEYATVVRIHGQFNKT